MSRVVRRFRVIVKVGYNEKEFAYTSWPSTSEMIRSLILGTDDVEFRVRTEFEPEQDPEEVEADE